MCSPPHGDIHKLRPILISQTVVTAVFLSGMFLRGTPWSKSALCMSFHRYKAHRHIYVTRSFIFLERVMRDVSEAGWMLSDTERSGWGSSSDCAAGTDSCAGVQQRFLLLSSTYMVWKPVSCSPGSTFIICRRVKISSAKTWTKTGSLTTVMQTLEKRGGQPWNGILHPFNTVASTHGSETIFCKLSRHSWKWVSMASPTKNPQNPPEVLNLAFLVKGWAWNLTLWKMLGATRGWESCTLSPAIHPQPLMTPRRSVRGLGSPCWVQSCLTCAKHNLAYDKSV